MPTKPARPCKQRGCPELTTGPSGHCPLHKKEAQHLQDTARGSSSKRGYTRRWRKARRHYLNEHPLCVQCEKEGIIEAATEVHHIKALRNGGTHEDNNLMALCKSCHSRITARENGAFGNKTR